MLVPRYDPGTEPDRADYRHCRPAQPCEGLVLVGGLDRPVWSPGRIHVWQHRPWGMPRHVGPDGWWAWGQWYPSPNRRWGGWLHETERPPSATRGPGAVTAPRACRTPTADAAPQLPAHAHSDKHGPSHDRAEHFS